MKQRSRAIVLVLAGSLCACTTDLEVAGSIACENDAECPTTHTCVTETGLCTPPAGLSPEVAIGFNSATEGLYSVAAVVEVVGNENESIELSFSVVRDQEECPATVRRPSGAPKHLRFEGSPGGQRHAVYWSPLEDASACGFVTKEVLVGQAGLVELPACDEPSETVHPDESLRVACVIEPIFAQLAVRGPGTVYASTEEVPIGLAVPRLEWLTDFALDPEPALLRFRTDSPGHHSVELEVRADDQMAWSPVPTEGPFLEDDLWLSFGGIRNYVLLWDPGGSREVMGISAVGPLQLRIRAIRDLENTDIYGPWLESPWL